MTGTKFRHGLNMLGPPLGMSERSEDNPSLSAELRSKILFNGKYFPLNVLCWKIFAHIKVNLLDNGKKQSHTLASCVLMSSALMSIQRIWRKCKSI